MARTEGKERRGVFGADASGTGGVDDHPLYIHDDDSNMAGEDNCGAGGGGM